MNHFTKQVFFLLLAALCFAPFMSPPIALAIGIVFAIAIGNPFQRQSAKVQKFLLQACVVGLGFGMDLASVIEAGKTGFLFTVVTIFGTLALGFIVGKWLGLGRSIRHLISSGTAICGGSAIAAVGSAMNADTKEMSVSLATVFVLNAIALFVFPILGVMLHMTPQQFGIWCAVAIHDTSSVVGAASNFSPVSLAIATTVKLARALWIIPLALGTAFAFRGPAGAKKKITIPWFIFLFVLASVVRTVAMQNDLGFWITTFALNKVVDAAKIGLTLVLFLIGAGLSKQALKTVGAKPLIFGVILWIVISVTSLLVVLGTV